MTSYDGLGKNSSVTEEATETTTEDISDATAKTAAEPEKLQAFVSVTDLASYMYCQRAVYQQKVLGYAEKPSKAMVFGSIRHNFYDMANKYEEKIVVHLPAGLPREEILSAYLGTYNSLLRSAVITRSKALSDFDLNAEEVIAEMKPMALAEATERAENLHSFATQNGVYGEKLWELLTPKIITELKVKSPSLRLKGTVDRVEIHKNAVLPIELKTGKMAKDGVWPSHRVQVAAYMILLQEMFNTPINQAMIRYLDYKSTRTVRLNPYMELEVKEITEKVLRLLASNEIPKACGRENCSCTR